jgi:predicted RNA-binding Zn-ribbon protein involved in translation (DUF1610 family)
MTHYVLSDEEAEAVEESIERPCPRCGRYGEWLYSRSVDTASGVVHYLDCDECGHRGKVLRP